MRSIAHNLQGLVHPFDDLRMSSNAMASSFRTKTCTLDIDFQSCSRHGQIEATRPKFKINQPPFPSFRCLEEIDRAIKGPPKKPMNVWKMTWNFLGFGLFSSGIKKMSVFGGEIFSKWLTLTWLFATRLDVFTKPKNPTFPYHPLDGIFRKFVSNVPENV